MITLRGVGVEFGPAAARVRALDAVDLDFPAGGTTALIGPSGCGKSTLLRLLVGLVHPTTGSLGFAGPLEAGGAWQARRHRTGYVIQDGGLFPHLTARENVLLPVMARRTRPTGIEERLASLARLARLPEAALQRYPVELSGGQRQRVALMRALLPDPDLLLLDEPLAALDPMVRAALQDDLKEIIAGTGKTVVLVTHDMAEAAWLADRLVLMAEGRVVQQGALEDLRERPATPWVTEFLSAQRRRVPV